MKYLLLCLLSFNCLAQENINECGQTRLEWTYGNVKCLEIRGTRIVESYFIGDVPNLAYDLITLEELEEQWELIDE